MVARIVVSVVGGSVITVAMLLGMNEVTKHFKDRDPTQYFVITDFIPGPERRVPTPLPAPAPLPERAQINLNDTHAPRPPAERPQIVEQRLPPPPPRSEHRR